MFQQQVNGSQHKDFAQALASDDGSAFLEALGDAAEDAASPRRASDASNEPPPPPSPMGSP